VRLANDAEARFWSRAGTSVHLVSEPGAPPLPALEFWPDYGDGPLWSGGDAVDLDAVGLAADLVARLTAFNEAYQEGRLPLDGPGDLPYLAEGERLLHAVREALDGQYRVLVTEPWWGEEPSEDDS
jgi:hypothetical protein